MQKAIIFLLILAVGLLGWQVSRLSVNTPAASVQAETSFDRIMRTGVLRCGYAVATPWFMMNPNTHQPDGVDTDVVQNIAERTHLKIEWAEETGWGTAEQGLISGRYDALCGSVCIDANRDRAATYSTPFVHIPILAAVRQDDNRFGADLTKLDDPTVRIGVKNNHVFEYIAKERFPHATLVYANDISDDTEFLTMLATSKIDIAFTGQSTIDGYNKNNTAKIRSLPNPARYCHGAFMVPSGDMRLKNLLDDAIMQMNSSGLLEKIIGKYMPVTPQYIGLPALPYR